MTVKLTKSEPRRVDVRMSAVEVRASDEGGVFTEIEGIAQVFDEENDWGEVFAAGSFTETIKERVPQGMVKITDGHQNRASSVIAVVTEAEERKASEGAPAGVWFKARVMPTRAAQEVALLANEGGANEFSIEFIPVERRRVKDGGREFSLMEKVIWRGLALLPYSSQARPTVLAVREDRTPALPVSERERKWDPSAAEERLSALGSDERAEAYLLNDGGVMRFPVCDVREDNRLELVPAALTAAFDEVCCSAADLSPETRGAVLVDLAWLAHHAAVMAGMEVGLVFSAAEEPELREDRESAIVVHGEREEVELLAVRAAH